MIPVHKDPSRRRDPATYERGAQLAREALNREDTDRE